MHRYLNNRNILAIRVPSCQVWQVFTYEPISMQPSKYVVRPGCTKYAMMTTASTRTTASKRSKSNIIGWSPTHPISTNEGMTKSKVSNTLVSTERIETDPRGPLTCSSLAHSLQRDTIFHLSARVLEDIALGGRRPQPRADPA